jgi:hypothetical protein
MTEKNVVFVARAVALYLLCWLGSELTYLPVRIIEVWHYLRHTKEYFQDVYVVGFGFALIRIILLLLIAGWLYRCGPRVKAFFMEPTPESDADVSGKV